MSENAVAVREEITAAKVTEYLDSAGITDSLLPHEKKMFVNIAREFGLNPFKREIHITAYGKGDYRKCSIITGYEVYIKRAERTGKLDGWKVWTEGEGKNMKALVEIYRKDHKYPFIHEAYYIECVQYNKEGQPNAVWAKQPRFMTKKVAIGQAFRLCFPDDLGGMPYEEAEVPQEEPRNVTEEPSREQNPTPQPHDPTPTKQTDTQKTDRQRVIDEIVATVKTQTPDGFYYFADEERASAKASIQETKDFSALKKLAVIYQTELDIREANYVPIPFGDDPATATRESNAIPSMYNESADEEQALAQTDIF